MKNPIEGVEVTASVIAKICGISVMHVGNLRNDGIIESKGKPAKYEVIPTLQKIFEHQKKIAEKREKSKSVKDNEAAKLAAEVRYKEAKAESMELQLKEQKGKLHRAEDVEAIVTDNIMTLRGMLLALPGQLAVDVSNASSAMECSEIIKKAVYQILNDLADYEYDSEAYRELILKRYGITWGEDEDGAKKPL